MFKKNKNKGFSLIELITALGIIALLSGFAITSILVIPQARMRETAQTIKSEFELTRNFAKTHGGEATFKIAKIDGGLQITREGKNIITESYTIDDKELTLFYKETKSQDEYELGVKDADDVQNATLEMRFSQTDGAIIGPHMLDYIIISNGSKNFKFIIKQSTGMMYYDYEIEQSELEGNMINGTKTTVQVPTFIQGKELKTEVNMTYTGETLQPELNYDARNVKLGGVYRAIYGGTYSITFTLKDPYSMIWSDGTTEPKTLTWKIT